LAAVNRGANTKGDNEVGEVEGIGDFPKYYTMSISTLRNKLHEEGLECDGSREALIASLEKIEEEKKK
jgi:hypothetical protein